MSLFTRDAPLRELIWRLNRHVSSVSNRRVFGVSRGFKIGNYSQLNRHQDRPIRPDQGAMDSVIRIDGAQNIAVGAEL